ncbi:ABC transporter ATP-binding protein [Boseongicola sp. H5]|uniref:ABC transporter ATP-binding protein n=1 Tax=Rhodobacterales TaxID=204455 RepID=UPI001B0D9EC9|nr:sn-glycerol-3-phosphate ABC transporter ATP-binding protein UgpC [Boseongicola sp. H5]MBO6626674.1 sn-glycerol-3-phosphate ABC transporter ATP-binding protein UgpC [Roseicyclus sp.]MBO6922976.1 sn-glycerol-3-phosphate ABC transporter ATP-binding protein UgpC [Roseicyclus sp.]
MSGVTLSNVVKKYGDVKVIHGVDLQIDHGDFCVFVGPSGCGKSTLLRMVAGLEETTGGRIEIGDRDVTHMDPADRGVAMVFQTYALYPHMTVAENMGFGLKMNGHPKEEIRKKVTEASRVLKLDDYLARKPKALSGGQRQRVAIGRAIVRGPEVFLFDEPLSNLDAELRVEMRVEIARLHQEIGATMIYVTHDQVEAMTLADKIVVLRAGIIEQAGRPLDLYNDPDNQFVAGFIGSPAMNFFPGQAAAGLVTVPGLGGAEMAPGLTSIGTGAVTVGLRPQHLKIVEGETHRVDLSEQLGGVAYHYLTAQDGTRIIVEAHDQTAPAPGSTVGLSFDPDAPLFFDADSGLRLR